MLKYFSEKLNPYCFPFCIINGSELAPPPVCECACSERRFHLSELTKMGCKVQATFSSLSNYLLFFFVFFFQRRRFRKLEQERSVRNSIIPRHFVGDMEHDMGLRLMISYVLKTCLRIIHYIKTDESSHALSELFRMEFTDVVEA